MKPKKGDSVSIKNVGYGVTSYEAGEIDRVSKGLAYVNGLDYPFEIPSGRWTLPNAGLGLTTSVLFDGGEAFRLHGDE
jgi:hypothetical protein